MKKATKTAAIQFARKMVSELYKFGDGYKFNVWDEDCNAWREHGGGDYWVERAHRAECLIIAACMYMGAGEYYAMGAAYEYINGGGSWVDYVPETVQGVES